MEVGWAPVKPRARAGRIRPLDGASASVVLRGPAPRIEAAPRPERVSGDRCSRSSGRGGREGRMRCRLASAAAARRRRPAGVAGARCPRRRRGSPHGTGSGRRVAAAGVRRRHAERGRREAPPAVRPPWSSRSIALIVALSGTAIAAVDFAHDARSASTARAPWAAQSPSPRARGRQARRDRDRRAHGRGQHPRDASGGRASRGGTMTLSKYAARGRQPARGASRRCSSSRGCGRFDAQCDDVDPTAGDGRPTRTSISRHRVGEPGGSTPRACSGATSAPASVRRSSTAPRVSRCRSSPCADGLVSR